MPTDSGRQQSLKENQYSNASKLIDDFGVCRPPRPFKESVMFINSFRHRYFSFCFPFSPWLHTRPGRTNQERKKREEGLIARHEQGKGQQLG